MATPPPPVEAPRRRLTAWQAVLAGQIVVNLPVVILFCGVYQLAGPVLPADQFGYWLRLIASFAALAVNLTSAFAVVRASARAMKESGGSIVLILWPNTPFWQVTPV